MKNNQMMSEESILSPGVTTRRCLEKSPAGYKIITVIGYRFFFIWKVLVQVDLGPLTVFRYRVVWECSFWNKRNAEEWFLSLTKDKVMEHIELERRERERRESKYAPRDRWI